MAEKPLLEERFTLERRVARGAFGEVFRGHDRQTDRPVAIKRLHAHLRDAQSLERFQREASILARIDSPYLVRHVADARDADGRACLVLEWLDGQDLAGIQKARSVVLEDAVEMAHQAALGLDALHQAGVVHGDVKPSNFFVVEGDGPLRVKLIDLGVARLAMADASFDGLIVGTPSYMSPEQARGDDALAPTSDLFSLGVVLYQLLSGRRPFSGGDPFAVLAKILLEEPPRLIAVAPHVPPELDEVVMRALAKQPADRFQSAIEMATALELAPTSRVSSPPPLDETPTIQMPRDLEVLRPLPGERMSPDHEQRVVTAVFASFSRTAAGAMATFATIVSGHRGTTEKTLGRRMIAVFGAARSSGDEVERAARAAMTAVSRIPGLRVAITTGRAALGAGGLSGESIERGASDVERARPGAVRVDAATARLLAGTWAVDGGEGAQVIVGERALGGGTGPRLLGRETPMVGRDDDLAELEALYDECARLRVSRAVLVTGPAGSGKSRLRYELLERLRAGGGEIEILMGRGDSLSAGAPFGLIAEAIRRSAGLLAGEPLEVHQRKLRARVARRLSGKAVGRVSEFLGELVNVPFPDQSSKRLRAARNDAMLMGDAMLAAWEDWLGAECAAQPVVLVLEDLHWGDLPTIKFVDAALRNLRDQPFLVLAMARPEVHDEFPDLWAERSIRTLRLGSIPQSAAAELVRAALGPGTESRVVELLAHRCEGNAFYLEELIRAVAAGGDEHGLPETVLGMVQARLDALGADAKRVLRAASVFGRTFWSGGVTALLGGAELVLVRDCLRDLVEREVILERSSARLPGETEFAFRHATIRDAAYATLTEEDRATGHRLAGAWLEQAGEIDAATLAEHHARGNEPARAAGLYLRGAEQALEGNDLEGVVDRAERGIRCLEASGDAAGETFGALRLLQAEAHRWRGEFALVDRRAAEAAEHVAPATNAWFRAAGEVVTANGRLGNYARAAEWLVRASAVGPVHERASEGDPIGDAERAKILCLSRGVLHLIYGGLRDQADPIVAHVERLAADEDRLDPIALARVHQMRAVIALHAGDPARYLIEQQTALAAFDEAGDGRSACLAEVSVGSGCADLGVYDGAEDALRRALVSAERMGLRHIAPWALQNLGHVLLRRGQLDESRAALGRALDAGTAQGDARLAGGSRIYLSRVAYRTGDADEAEREARTAAELLATVPHMRAAALAALAQALLLTGKTGEATAAAREAMGLLDALGTARMGEVESFVRISLAEALLAAGETDAARAALEAARGRLLERAAKIRDETWRQSFLERVPEHARTMELFACTG